MILLVVFVVAALTAADVVVVVVAVIGVAIDVVGGFFLSIDFLVFYNS